jgi:hypothetical protein
MGVCSVDVVNSERRKGYMNKKTNEERKKKENE